MKFLVYTQLFLENGKIVLLAAALESHFNEKIVLTSTVQALYCVNLQLNGKISVSFFSKNVFESSENFWVHSSPILIDQRALLTYN